MNTVALVGNLTQDPELRHTQNGSAVVSFTVAVNERYGNQENTYWIDCVAWNKTAEILHQYFHRGSKIGVEGKLTTRTWEGQKGKVKVTEVVVDRLTFLEAKRSAANEAPVVVEDDKDLPFGDDEEYDQSDLPF